MPAAPPETNLPRVSDPRIGYDFIGQPLIVVDPADDTAVARFQVKRGDFTIKSKAL
jgi:hypothetical protein